MNSNKYIDILNDIYNSIYNNDIELLIKKIKELINDKNNRYEYLNMMLNPDIYKFSKIPSITELPTCTFYYHQYYNQILGDEGKCTVVFNPFFLYYEDLEQINMFEEATDPPEQYMYDLNFYNNSGLKVTGEDIDNASSNLYGDCYAPLFLTSYLMSTSTTHKYDMNTNTYYPENLHQTIPRFYERYRLVSACIKVTFNGKLSESKGRIGCGIVLNSDNYVGCRLFGAFWEGSSYDTQNINHTYNDNLIQFNSDKALTSAFYYKINPCHKGIKMVYFPPDNSYEQFICPLDIKNLYLNEREVIENNTRAVSATELALQAKNNYKNGFKFIIKTFDLPVNTGINVDISCNYECIPNSLFLNVLPINATSFKLDLKDKKDMVNIIRKKPILDLDEEIIINKKEDWHTELRKIDNDELKDIGNIYID